MVLWAGWLDKEQMMQVTYLGSRETDLSVQETLRAIKAQYRIADPESCWVVGGDSTFEAAENLRQKTNFAGAFVPAYLNGR